MRTNSWTGEGTSSTFPQARVTAFPLWQKLVRSRAWTPDWEVLALLCLLAFSAVLYLWDLGREGMANAFYSAAVMSGSQSWKAFFFGSFDAASFVTVDKPPVALWVMELSARLFGFSSWSMLVPQALAGVAAAGLMFITVRRHAGAVAGLIAALVLALTPVAALMFRYNQPDGILTLLLVASAYTTLRAVESGRIRWLVATGVLLGFAFNTKMLQAFLVLPAFALVYLVAAPPRIGRRILGLLGAGIALLVSAGWWPVVVMLIPAAGRPYIDGSTNNSIWNLIFGYNGLGRIFSSSGGGGGGFGFGGAAGLGRLFNAENGGQVSWLLPLAGLALVVGLALRWRAVRTDLGRAGYLLWGGWALVTVAVFSFMTGIFHPYYSVALAPAVGALVGMGLVDLWRLRHSSLTRWLLPAGFAVTGVWAFVLLGRTPDFQSWLRYAVLVVSLLSALVLLIPLSRRLAVAAITAGLVAVLAGPAAYTFDTVLTTQSGATTSAGPAVSQAGGFQPPAGGGNFQPPDGAPAFAQPPAGSAGVPSGGTFGNRGQQVSASPALVKYLLANRGQATWIAAVEGSMNAGSLELTSGQPVMAMGGFLGSDPTPTLSQFQSLVAQGKVRYLLVQSDGGAIGGRAIGGGSSGGTVAQVVSWAEAHGKVVTIAGVSGFTVYDLQGAAAP
jgi:4-amino-4-deoxy-L-arabinose transferase-like glycosyltransferase